MSDYFIYHPGTGTMISLSDSVYLIDADILTFAGVEEYSEGVINESTAALDGILLNDELLERIAR